MAVMWMLATEKNCMVEVPAAAVVGAVVLRPNFEKMNDKPHDERRYRGCTCYHYGHRSKR